jgi:hypothetical protein
MQTDADISATPQTAIAIPNRTIERGLMTVEKNRMDKSPVEIAGKTFGRV